MHEIITGSLAKQIDTYAIGTLGIPSLKLMERAAYEVYVRVKHRAETCGLSEKARILIFCGTGNNGADGLCAGAMLLSDGYTETEAVIVGDEMKGSEEFRYQKERFLHAGGRISGETETAQETLPEADILVDALFGIGLKRAVTGVFAEAIERMNLIRNNSGAYVISVDIPSGIDADHGRNMCAPLLPVHADETVTFGFAKTGHYLDYGYGNCGNIMVFDIGYPEGIAAGLSDGRDLLTDTKDVFLEHADAFFERDARANKGSYLRLLIAAGSEGMAGAAYLSGLSAFRLGIGMVRYLGAEANRPVLQTLLPEAMYEVLQEADADSALRIQEQIEAGLSWADIVILGPGLSQGEGARQLVRSLLEEIAKRNRAADADGGRKPIFAVIDADALNIIAKERDLLGLLSEHTVLTPHVGELARLTGHTVQEIKENFVDTAADFAAQYHTNIIAKDCVSVAAVWDKEAEKPALHLNLSGSAAMAKAGSGDSLTGMIAGCTAVTGSFEAAIPAAAYLHGRAGEAAAQKHGIHGILARELAESIEDVLLNIN
ncbi:MAG: NAD(P)H-hydrate dehydratase [Eubacteriales bacterium]|nr:NAD(P)H-hydrate dehydratase [Eubacteriales bacterium]